MSAAPDARLRDAMVAEMRRGGTLANRVVAQAFASVPRHQFVPHVPLADAYADRAISIKSEEGATIASISQPSMLARMLELVEITPGDRVLEIGTGSGYNAALASRIAGASGRVVSVEIEEDLVGRARATLQAQGFGNVDVIAGDGHAGFAAAAPYDRIIVSARASDIATPWWEQLKDGGRIVVPLEIGVGGEYAVAFTREGAFMRSVGIVHCLFVPLRGEQMRTSEEIFTHSAAARYGDRERPITGVSAVRTAQARPEMLEHADVVVVRPSTTFAIVWS